MPVESLNPSSLVDTPNQQTQLDKKLYDFAVQTLKIPVESLTELVKKPEFIQDIVLRTQDPYNTTENQKFREKYPPEEDKKESGQLSSDLIDEFKKATPEQVEEWDKAKRVMYREFMKNLQIVKNATISTGNEDIKEMDATISA